MDSIAAKTDVRRGRIPAARPDRALIERARSGLVQIGQTAAEWAKINGESVETVYKVLSGKHACTAGDGHRIAVKLGIKDGVVAPASRTTTHVATRGPGHPLNFARLERAE